MPEIEVPCPTCAATGNMTPGGGRNNLKDRCTTCGGKRTIPARPGESRETSWPFAVPGAEQVPSSTPGEAERLVENVVRAARDCGADRERGDEECLAIAEGHEAAARTALQKEEEGRG